MKEGERPLATGLPGDRRAAEARPMAENIPPGERLLLAVRAAKAAREEHDIAMARQRAQAAALRTSHLPEKLRLPAMRALLAEGARDRMQAVEAVILAANARFKSLSRSYRGGRPGDENAVKRAEHEFLASRLEGAKVEGAIQEAMDASGFSRSYIQKLRVDRKWDAELTRRLKNSVHKT